MSQARVFILSFFFVVFCGSHLNASSFGVQDSVGTVQKEGEGFIEYLVSPGETIYRISTAFGISISRLMEVNPELENGLKAGQIILVPSKEIQDMTPQLAGSSASTPVNDQKVHTVQPGETLYSLSRKYNVSVGDLLKWNGMELKAGQKLVVGYKSEGEDAPEDEFEPVVADPKKAEVHTYVSQDVSGNEYTVYNYDSNYQQVLIVPFDPHLYFSDADDEIARASRIPRIKVREVFRRRLNVLLEARGYENIFLLGGTSRDTLSDLNKIYSSVTYNYQQVLYSDAYMEKMAAEEEEKPSEKSSPTDNMRAWIDKTRKKLTDPQNDKEAHREKFMGKYFGVRVTDPRFFDYFNRKYSIDYYIFINQFEVITDYENCLDRSAGNYARYFIAHFSIFDKNGEQIAGNKFKVHYDSNTNNIDKICGDNMIKIADRVLTEMPPADRGY